MSSGHQRITGRRNIAENFNRLSRVHERYRQTDDRQTDGRTTTYSEHEHEFTFAKNYSIWLLTFLVTRVPNIMKIGQCFLQLQLQMLGMFFLRQCRKGG